jgi:hypothetical protein
MADISKTTNDSNGIARLLSNSILSLQFVDVSKSEFANPGGTFSGYAADGYYYISGSPAPTYSSSFTYDGITYLSEFKATWAAEAEHSVVTSQRNLLDRFPDRMFVVATDKEVTLLDADDLTVWMRFTLSSSSISSAEGPLLGGTEASVVGARFSEGVLYVATTKGIRVADFKGDVGRYITSSDCFVGFGVGSRNLPTFYIYDEFEPSEALLTSDWSTIGTPSYAYASDDLLLYLRLDDGWSDESGNWDNVSQAKSVHSGSDYPALVSDTPKTLTGSDPHSMSFSNSSKSSADWDGAFGYVDHSVSMSIQTGQQFSFSMFVKINSRGDASWTPRPSMPLFSKKLVGSDMQTRFSEGHNLYEFSASLSSLGYPQFTIYLNNDPDNSITYTAGGVSPEVPLDTWTHLSFTYNGGGVDEPAAFGFYKNGAFTNTLVKTTGSAFDKDAEVTPTDAPLLIGNSGEDTSTIDAGDWLDGNLLEFGYWIKTLGQTESMAMKVGLVEGVPRSSEDPPFLQVDSCSSIDSAVVEGDAICVLGHDGGTTVIRQINNGFPVAYTNDFSVTYDAGDWDIGTTTSDLTIVTTTATGLSGNGWVKGDLITLDGSTYIIEQVNNSTIETTTAMTAHPSDSSAIVIKRTVPAVLLDGKDLYYAHSLSKVARESTLWYSQSNSINPFDAVTGVVSINGAEVVNNFAVYGDALYVSTDCGVFYISDDIFGSSSTLSGVLQYSSSAGDARYPVVVGGADAGTCVGIDPENGHLLVANTGTGSTPSVTEIDTSIHQAFQSFDSSTSPAVTNSVTAMTTYRNVKGPPDVEVS